MTRRALPDGLLDLVDLVVGAPIVEGPPRWPEVLAQAEAHRVSGTLAWRTAQAGWGSGLPEALASRRSGALEQAIARNALIGADVSALDEALRDVGIRGQLEKGAALLALDVAGAVTRFLSDIDVRVAPDDLRRLPDALERAGFEPVRRRRRDGSWTDPQCDDPRVVPGDQPSWRAPHGTLIDLHVGVVPDGDAGAGSPGASAVLHQLAAHVGTKHGWRPPFLVRHLADVALLLDAGLVRARGEGPPRAEAFPWSDPSATSVALVDNLRQGGPGREEAVRSVAAAVAPPLGAILAMGLRRRVAGLRRLGRQVARSPGAALCEAVPHVAYMEQTYGVSRRSPRIALCYLDRAGRFALPWLPQDRPWWIRR